MLIARRRPFAVRKKYGDGFPSRSLIIGWGPVSTWWLHNAEFNSASKPEETIAPSEASPPCSNIQIIKSDRRDARLIIMQTSRSSVRLAEIALSFDTGGMLFPLLVALIAGRDLLLSANLLFVAALGRRAVHNNWRLRAATNQCLARNNKTRCVIRATKDRHEWGIDRGGHKRTVSVGIQAAERCRARSSEGRRVIA